MTNSQTVWTEKYRPKSLDDITEQDNLVGYLRQGLKTGQLNHLLLYGAAGTGKTSIALVLARELFGSNFRDRILELNASSARGIDIVRTKIKDFASTKINAVTNTKLNLFSSFKLIILDEADAMTKDAQNALRRIMEIYSANVKFILLCNYVGKIIPAIISRCVQFRFTPLTFDNAQTKLMEICEKEHITMDKSASETLVNNSKGDLRKSITNLQIAKSLNSSKMDGQNNAITINSSDIETVLQVIPQFEISGIFNALQQKNLNLIFQVAQHFHDESYNLQLLFEQLTGEIIHLPAANDSQQIDKIYIDDLKKSKMLKVIAELDQNLSLGSHSYLECLSVLSKLFIIFHNTN